MLNVNDVKYKLYLSYPSEWDFIKKNVSSKRIDSIIEEKICHFENDKIKYISLGLCIDESKFKESIVCSCLECLKKCACGKE